MTLKPVILPVKLLENGDMSTALTSEVLHVQYMDNVGFQINVLTSDAYGDFSVEASIDGENWSPLILSPTVSSTGASSTFLVNINQTPFSQLRVVYEPTSGDGYATVWTTAKII